MPKYTLKKALADTKKVIEEQSAELSKPEPKGLFSPIKYTLDLGGKRLRPLLALLAYKACNPKGKLEEIKPVMKAVELFHNFSLIHDDLMDDAPIRRGKPTVYKKWGSAQAVLSGDAMLIEAYTALSETEPGLTPTLLHTFNQMAQGVCIGQQLDMEFETRPIAEISIEEHSEMIFYKTGALLTGSVAMGALVGDISSPEDLDTLSASVSSFGSAFQIMDDYLDIFSEDEEFGKRRGGDILEGKRTWLLLDAYSKSPEEVEKALATEGDDDKINAMTDLYRRLHTDEDAVRIVEELTDNAIEGLDGLPFDTSLFRELYSSLLDRRS